LQKGSIPASKVGGLWRFKKAQLDKWLDERMVRYNANSKRPTAKKAVTGKPSKKADYNQLRDEVAKIVARIARVELSDVKDDADIREELGVDSLSAMEILASIEKKYSIEIDEAKAFDIVTLKDVVQLVASYL